MRLKKQNHTQSFKARHKKKSHTRCSRPLYSSHTPPHTTCKTTNKQPNTSCRHHTEQHCPRHPIVHHHMFFLKLTHYQQGANSSLQTVRRLVENLTILTPQINHPHTNLRVLGNRPLKTAAPHSDASTASHRHPNWDAHKILLRKEVIQPHLPVRLPCYDFVPIADPTFDHSPHKGWAVGFGCYRLS